MGKIRVIVDAKNDSGESLSALPNLKEVVHDFRAQTLELDADVLSDDLEKIYKNLVDSILRLRDVSDQIEIKDIEFNLGVDSEGKISLLSSVSGSSVTKAGIKFSLSFKD